MKYTFSSRALEELERRNIPMSLVEAVMENPQQVVVGQRQRMIYQSQVYFDTGKLYLLRLFIDSNLDPPVVVTIYKTSKIQKYWRNP